MYQYVDECLYIAGPECFYPNGYDLWESMGKLAEYYGFRVVMPTKNELKLDACNPRENADTIFRNCADAMNQATAILTDLEAFRGSEPDGGSLYEVGMAYARGLRCYAFTRDKRAVRHKYQGVRYQNGVACDAEGRALPYADLPFCPSLVGSSKIVEGSFEDCLKLLMLDIDEERKTGRLRRAQVAPPTVAMPEKKRPRVYLAGLERYEADAAARYAEMKRVCYDMGMDAVSPLDECPGMPIEDMEDAYARAYRQLDRCTQHIRNCDILIAELNDFHGYEPGGDVAFECGFAWQLGKRCLGYMRDASPMRDRIPNLGAQAGFLDYCGYVVEDFNYPINLMFASSMPIVEGDFFTAIKAVEPAKGF